MPRSLNFAMFYLGWFACVIGAANGRFWLGPALVVALLTVHLSFSRDPRLEMRLIVLIGLFGFTCDTLLASAGAYAFTRTSVAPWLCPPWMVALWMIFATTLDASMAWLARRRGLAAVLGAACGAASYAAGARLGAIDLPANTFASLSAIAIAWAVVMPILFWLRCALQSPHTLSQPVEEICSCSLSK